MTRDAPAGGRRRAAAVRAAADVLMCLPIAASMCLSIAAWNPALAQHDESNLHYRGSQYVNLGDHETSKVYIVQLRTPSATEEHVSTAMRVAGKPAPGRTVAMPKFNKNSAAVQTVVQRIEAEQATVLARAGQDIEPIYSYRYALNGFAARMSPALASKLEHMPEVLRVWEDEVRPLATNYSADFLDLFASDIGLRGTLGLDGEGVIIGVIDSGIAPEHPALQDFREADRPELCQGIWSEATFLGQWLCARFDRMEDIILFDEPPEDWNGECQTGPEFTIDNCNNKLIGARFFVEGAEATGPIDDGEILSPRDVDGHGTHTATTAAGNRVKATIFGNFLGRVEGMAPQARIATYKACWLRPEATRASCNTSDLANAVDMAVADGVDIINYSVGSSLFTVTAPDDFALLAAAKAGVLTAVAGGNEGPLFDTIKSPAGNPAVITVAASSRDGEHAREAMQITAPLALEGKYAVTEASFTEPLFDAGPIEGQLVLVDDESTEVVEGSPETDPDLDGTTFDACQFIANASEVNGNIAFIQRGGCDFDVKVVNAQDAGAAGVVVFNLSGDPIVMVGDSAGITIPAVMVGAADGNLFLDEINRRETIEAVLDKTLLLAEGDTGNNMGRFSSRGPGPVADVLKPDVTAPGINILAGNTPDAANLVSGEFFAFLTGTSMSAPHVAGIAALLKQAYPEWSPAALKSALMTTAYQEVTLADGETPAIPFDFGSGHIDPNAAHDPGLVYDISADEYDAFSCGIASPDVDARRCRELEEAGFSFDGSDLNQPSISVSDLTATRTVTRRVTNVSDAMETYNAEIEMPPGIRVEVMPPSLSVAPGESAEYDVTFTFESGPLEFYRFGSLTWASSDHRVRSVLSVQPLSIIAPGDVFAFDAEGTLDFPVTFGYDGGYTPQVHGLNKPFRVDDQFIEPDPDKTFTPQTSEGINAHLFDIPPGQLFTRFALFDALTDGMGADDLDLYAYYCPPQGGCIKVGQSGGATSDEQIDLILPGAGEYVVFVHGFETANPAGTNYALVAWSFGVIDDSMNMTATGPANVTAGTTEDVTVTWSGLDSDTIYLGGISHNTPNGRVALTVISVEPLE